MRKKNKIKSLYYYSLLIFVLFPTITFGARIGGSTDGVGGGISIRNPIGVNSIEEFISAILDIVVAIGTPIAILFLIFAGFKFVWARGNPSELESAKKTLMWTIVGIVILLGASLLSQIVAGTIEQLKVGI